ncbi:MAG TPA: hypothetical protein VD997_17480 [Phycisphaerales bacterium]|nr:hypothetical protein [Phycisphaerales bacterium]
MAEPSPTADPLVASRRSTRRVALLAGLAILVAAGWALYLPTLDAPESPTLASAAAPAETPAPPLELAAFQTPVWTVAEPIKEAAAPPPPAPTPPLKVQLIGILKEGDSYKAVLYDPETNKVQVVAAGEDVQGRKVARIAADIVSIQNGRGMQMLTLKNQGATP